VDHGELTCGRVAPAARYRQTDHVDARVGLVGAGPWVDEAVLPAVLASPGVRLDRVWARRPDRAAEVAGAAGARAVATPEEAMADVDVVALCVPPDVQAGLLPAAVASGAALLLEKPVARTVEAAEVLHAATAPVHVHYARLVDTHLSPWLDAASREPWERAEVVLTNGATLGDDPFGRSPWRREPLGGLWDLGPHALAWLHLVLGPSTSVRAHHDGADVVLETVHTSGAAGRVVVSVASPDPQERFVLHAADGTGRAAPDGRQSGAATYAALLASRSGAADPDPGSPCWRAVADPAFSTAVVATLVEAAAQLDVEDRPASHRSASS
jgi:predicted dehydrogenase